MYYYALGWLLYLHYNGRVCMESVGFLFRGGRSEDGCFALVDHLFALKTAAAAVSKLTESELDQVGQADRIFPGRITSHVPTSGFCCTRAFSWRLDSGRGGWSGLQRCDINPRGGGTLITSRCAPSKSRDCTASWKNVLPGGTYFWIATSHSNTSQEPKY